jgi:hypothetical protein
MQVAIKIKSKIMIKNGIGFEGGEESESQGTESRDQRSDGGDQPPSSEDDGGLGAGTASPCTPLENTELPESGMRTEGHADRSEGLTGEEHAPGEQQAEIVAGKEAPQPPAGNTEIARAAGKAPKEEALPGDEIPQSEKVPWRYDPYEVSRKIREAEKARRMRRRQIDV